MAEVYTIIDQLKQATVNSLYNVINNSFGDNSVYSNMTCIYTNNEITQDDSIAKVSCYVSNEDNNNYITMANLPYAISWLRNPLCVGLASGSTKLDNTNMVPNDLCVLLYKGNYSKGNLSKLTDASLSTGITIDKGVITATTNKVANCTGYLRASDELSSNATKSLTALSSLSRKCNADSFTVSVGSGNYYVDTNGVRASLSKANLVCGIDTMNGNWYAYISGCAYTGGSACQCCTLNLSAFTGYGTGINSCSNNGTYTLTPSTPSVTIPAGYTGGGTVRSAIPVFKSINLSNLNDGNYAHFPDDIGYALMNEYLQVPSSTIITSYCTVISYSISQGNITIDVTAGSVKLKFLDGTVCNFHNTGSNIYISSSQRGFSVIYKYTFEEPISIDSFVCDVTMSSASVAYSSSGVKSYNIKGLSCSIYVWNSESSTIESHYITYEVP